jgi:foldase protein PrsA
MSEEMEKTESEEIVVDEAVVPEEAKTEEIKADQPATSGKKLLMNFGLGAFIGLVVIGMAVVGVMVYGGYHRGWGGPSSSIISSLSLPAATVNGEAITYREYSDDLATARRVFAKANAEDPSQAIPTEANLRKGVLERLVENVVLEQEAKRLNATVSDEELEAEFAKMTAAAGGEDPVKTIQETYGWTKEQFKRKAMRPYFLAQKITAALAENPEAAAAVEKRAQFFLDKIKAGEDFAKIARENSDDKVSAMQDGDLGFFAKEVMVPEFADAAFKLKVGETSGLVKTKFGYHIIRVTDVKKDKKGEVTEVKASHVLFAMPDAQAELKKKIDEAKKVYYVKIDEETTK